MPFRSSNYEGEEAWTLVYRHEAKVLKSDKIIWRRTRNQSQPNEKSFG